MQDKKIRYSIDLAARKLSRNLYAWWLKSLENKWLIGVINLSLLIFMVVLGAML